MRQPGPLLVNRIIENREDEIFRLERLLNKESRKIKTDEEREGRLLTKNKGKMKEMKRVLNKESGKDERDEEREFSSRQNENQEKKAKKQRKFKINELVLARMDGYGYPGTIQKTDGKRYVVLFEEFNVTRLLDDSDIRVWTGRGWNE